MIILVRAALLLVALVVATFSASAADQADQPTMLPEVMVLLVRSDRELGQGSLKVGKGLYLALSAPLIEKILKEKPATARCFVGSVIWQAGELDEQIKDGAWSVVQAEPEMVFSKNPENLWESLQHKSRQLTAQLSQPGHPVMALQ